MARPRSCALLQALLLSLAAASCVRLAEAEPCPAGYFWDAAASWCLPCGNGHYCPGGTAARATCPWTKGTVTPTASALSDCVPVSCNPCGVPAAGLYEPRDVVYSTGSGASNPNSLFVQLGEEGGLSAHVHFVCTFGSLGTSVGIGDVAMIHTGDILVLFTTGAFKLLPATSLTALKAASGANGLDVPTRRCSSIGARDLPAATKLPTVAGETWGGLTTGLWSNVVYASVNQGKICSFEFSGTGASLTRSTTAFVCRSCKTASQPHCGGSNTGTDITTGADGHVYLWTGADNLDPFQGYKLDVDAATGHLHATAPMILTNRGIKDALGRNQTDRAFTNAAAVCVDGGKVLGMAMRVSNNQGAVWRFGDQFDDVHVTPAAAMNYTLRTFNALLQNSFKFNGAATRTLCVGSSYCDTCDATGTATCGDHGCACKAGYVGLTCSRLGARCSDLPLTNVANATWACASGTPHGGTCSATCAAGYEGAPTAKCYDGTYVALVGNCTAGLWATLESKDTAARSWWLTCTGGVLLQGGDVLVAGGVFSPGLSSASLYSPSWNNFSAAGTMFNPRHYHTATAFDGGRLVLVTGGQSTSGVNLNSAEVYDVSSDTWTNTQNNMATPRILHAAALISGGSADGSTLVVGGNNNGSPLSSAELFNGSSFEPTGSLQTARYDATATSLPGGKVLVAGGINSTWQASATAEIWQDGTFTRIDDSMGNARAHHTATAVQGGRAVLVVGGWRPDGSQVPTAELFDVETRTWSDAGSLGTGLRMHAATLLHGGTVLVCGGLTPSSATNLCKAWHPDAPTTWAPFPSLQAARSRHAMVTLGSGHALVIDGESGLDSAERFSLSSGPDPCAACAAETACTKAAQCIGGECQPVVNIADGMPCSIAQGGTGSCVQGVCV